MSMTWKKSESETQTLVRPGRPRQLRPQQPERKPSKAGTVMTATSVASYAAQNATSPLAPFSIHRREPGPTDVAIEILYCGVCHSDLHQARNEWGNTIYPCVPGHEIVGRVTGAGNRVTKFKAGDHVAVGCMVDSC